MAKWGEGDPQWIVEERADATNVNNWHWTERDVSSWSSECLHQLLLGVQVEGPEGVCQLTEVTKLEGEASINNRKGKLFYFYEWQLRLSWLRMSCRGVKFRGTIDVSNLSDENDEDDLDVNLCKDQPNTPLLVLMKTSGIQEVRRVLGEYVRRLKSEFGQGMILPTTNALKQHSSVSTKKNEVKTNKTQISPAPKCSSSTAPCPTGDRNQTCSFDLKETFQTNAHELYRTFISQEFMQVFTRSSAVVDSCCGGKFQLLDGSISGQFTQLVPDKRIDMKWRFRTWPSNHYASVSLELDDRGDDTELRLECRGVPLGEEDSTREGWTRFYFQAIKQTFGY
ncbi:activator of 90 kDa heat shock protein ATPase homolog 1-like [Simochromis diagramma]|uniref:activator of 90 kDa heat shock protein ATPase homolog 1-like n=1 Tax=Simochromis diagramma TaxID=43689 RepID=UPI001A7E984D|nr:activator of 90 kDa heat shock protein ATPase homolog 1-like [Simochromis diagramma]